MELNSETAHYISTHYNNLLSFEEKIVVKYILTSFKQPGSEADERIRKLTVKLGWITESQPLLQLMLGGEEKFEIFIANKISERFPDKIFMNYCPKCGGLARTPLAKVCRHCGYSWHE